MSCKICVIMIRHLPRLLDMFPNNKYVVFFWCERNRACMIGQSALEDVYDDSASAIKLAATYM